MNSGTNKTTNQVSNYEKIRQAGKSTHDAIPRVTSTTAGLKGQYLASVRRARPRCSTRTAEVVSTNSTLAVPHDLDVLPVLKMSLRAESLVHKSHDYAAFNYSKRDDLCNFDLSYL